jgi:hypothetical protein
LLKYGYEEFTITILEYCEINELVNREQYYLDNYILLYNLNRISSIRFSNNTHFLPKGS